MKKTKLLLLLLIQIYFGFAQNKQLSSNAEVSIITVGAGKSLNDTWGHSAIRVYDKLINLDQVYNYGMYDFDTPNFYTKFMQGKLLYDLGNYPFHYFLRDYIRANREVKEQKLQLSQEQKQAYYNFLENNAKPENKKYLYDFFFDNCATKLRDVTTEVLGDKVNYKDELLQNTYTFRDLIYQKLDKHPWGKFGIDIALGAVIDRKATPKEYTFLPEYVFENFKNATIIKEGKEIPLVKETTILYKKKAEQETDSFFKPMLVFSILALLVLFISYKDRKRNKPSKTLDFILLFTTGIVGLVVFLLWFATDHKATGNNFNVFWAFMPNLVVAFYVLKKNPPKFLKNYYLLVLILLLLTAVLWAFKIEVYNWALIPILIALAIRYVYNYLHLAK